MKKPPLAAIIIPARLESTRLPRKLLLRDSTGMTILERTYQAATWAGQLIEAPTFIATDSDEIGELAGEFSESGEQVVIRTGNEHPSGTSRVAEAIEILLSAGRIDENAIIINLQGDEPEIDPAAIERLYHRMYGEDWEGATGIVTLAAPLDYRNVVDLKRVYASSCVKVAVTSRETAAYFSRAPLAGAMHHLGVYAYSVASLRAIVDMPRSQLAAAEQLEQLDWLDRGCRIAVEAVEKDLAFKGIDTPEDYAAFILRDQRRLAGEESE